MKRTRRGRPPHPDVLTPAEWRVVEEVQRGRSNPEIAEALGVSVNTVRYHVSNALTKLGFTSRRELEAWDGRPEAAPRDARGVLGLPMLGWLSNGSVVTGSKVLGVATVSVAFVASVAVAFSFFASDSGLEHRSGAEHVVLAIDEFEVTEMEWRLAVDDARIRASGYRYRIDEHDGADDNEIAVSERYRELYETHTGEAQALGELLLHYAAAAHAIERGYEAADREIDRYVDEHRRFGEPAVRKVEAYGEDRYWDTIMPERAERAIAASQLLADELQDEYDAHPNSPAPGVAYRHDLARDAEVWLAPEITDVVSVQEALDYIASFETLIADLAGWSRTSSN